MSRTKIKTVLRNITVAQRIVKQTFIQAQLGGFKRNFCYKTKETKHPSVGRQRKSSRFLFVAIPQFRNGITAQLNY